MSDNLSISKHVIIAGRVQGVWYRAWTLEKAQSLGLSGWVKNKADGTVEAVFSGDKQNVNDMIAACWQGSRLSKVEAVTVSDCSEANDGPFTIR